MNQYYQESLVQVSTGAGFQNPSGVLTDPTVITLTVGIQGATPVISATFGVGNTIIKDSTGLYHALCDTTNWVPGVYWYKWVGTGNIQAVNEASFEVLPVNV